MTIPNMKTDLEKGQKGEKYILSWLPGFSQTDGKNGDLLNLKTNIFLEVKTESYTHKRVAIEQYSNSLTKSLGGVFQSQAKGNDFIIHVFSNNMAVLFKINTLVDFLISPSHMQELLKDCLDAKYFVKNNFYTTTGEKREHPWVTTGWAIPLNFFPKNIYNLIDLNKEKDISPYLIKD